MNLKRIRTQREWVLAQCRVTPEEIRRWHRAARQVDLSLSQAMRRSMRQFVREQEQQRTASVPLDDLSQ
jgi:hypothetical protein